VSSLLGVFCVLEKKSKPDKVIDSKREKMERFYQFSGNKRMLSKYFYFSVEDGDILYQTFIEKKRKLEHR
jgi:hypothetical protein